MTTRITAAKETTVTLAFISRPFDCYKCFKFVRSLLRKHCCFGSCSVGYTVSVHFHRCNTKGSIIQSVLQQQLFKPDTSLKMLFRL